MKIIVCLKVIKGEINPFDESALECALRLSNDVTVVSMGPESTEKYLLPLTRLGAKVILLSDNSFAGSDTLATSYILSVALKKMEYDLILCGRQSIDGDTAQVGPMLAQMLEIPVITNALSINDEMMVETRTEETVSDLPALITVERGYVLRFPSIFSSVGEVRIWNNKDIGCDVKKCGLLGSPTRVLDIFENEKGKRNCKFISKSELPDLIGELKNSAFQERIDIQNEKSKSEKFKSICIVGEEVLEKAMEIADEVVVLEKNTPEILAEEIKEKQAEVVLWNADLWGRSIAPQVAAILQTGLCADCTELESDGNNLIMYRPAQGGNIYAKIKCLTKPQMATVRTKSESNGIIIGCGRGVKDQLSEVRDFAKKIGGEIAASRGLVDVGVLPYELQVGLTGKTVSPDIYIAVGISGAVHHTCAIEGAGVVIAINPDKDARIFEYSDYGIIDKFL